MDCLSLLSDESIQNFSDRWGWEVEYQISGGSRISPRRGRQLPRGGANIRFCQIFPKTAWNWKNLAPREAHVPRAPLRSATGNQRINISHLSNRINEIKNSWLKALVPESPWIRHYSDSTKSLNSTGQSLKGNGQVQKSIETGYALRINHKDICRMFRLHNVFLQTDLFLDPKDSLLPSMQIS